MARSLQPDTERERRLPPQLVDELTAAGLYRMWVPRRLGGSELDLLTCFGVVEIMAEADGSVGWNLINNAVQQVSVLSLPDAGVEEIFSRGPDQILAGTLVPGGGRGRPVDGGYVVSGRWRFGSGCREAEWMMGNFQLSEEDDHVADSGVMRAVFPVEQCEIIDTWDMTGMRGTGSHDWSVNEVFVPAHRTIFVPGGTAFNQWQHWDGPLYQLPVHAIIGPHHSVVATGIARAGLTAFAELAGSKTPRGRSGLLRDHPHIQDWTARAEATLGGGRAYRQAVLEDVWDTVAAGEPTTLEQRARCRLAGSYAADAARQAMDSMFRAAGSTATEHTQRLAHCWRDLQTAGQAASVNPDWYPIVGRALLGLEPGPRLT